MYQFARLHASLWFDGEDRNVWRLNRAGVASENVTSARCANLRLRFNDMTPKLRPRGDQPLQIRRVAAL
jgi:hypothetical protein